MFYSGTQGKMFIDGAKAAKVKSWSFSSNLGLLDTTTLGDTDGTVTPGTRTNTGNCTILYYADSDGSGGSNSASDLINKLLKAGTGGVAAEADEVVMRLEIDDGGVLTGPRHVQANVYLTSVSMTCAVGEIFSADVSFQVNGAFSEVVM